MALSDIFDTSVVEVGKLKIGSVNPDAVSGSGKKYRAPVKLDHFVVTTLHRDAKGMLVLDADLMESLSDFADRDGKLRSLPVMFLSNRIEDVLQSRYVWYVGKKLGATSDGREVTFFYNPNTGRPLEAPSRKPWSDAYLQHNAPDGKGKLFKLFTTLNVVLAAGMARWGGVYKYRTTGQISGRQLYDSISLLHRLSGGILRGPLFRLVVRPMTVSPEGKTTTVHVVHVEYISNDPKALLTQAREQRAFEVQAQTQMIETEKQYRQLVAAQVHDEPDEDLLIVDGEPLPLPAKAESVEDLLGDAIDQATTAEGLSDHRITADVEHKRGRLDHDARNRIEARIAGRRLELFPLTQTRQAADPDPDPEPADADATPTEPTQPEPAVVVPPKAGRQIVEEITRLCTRINRSWNAVREELREELGLVKYRIQDLTAEQALAVHGRLKQMAEAEPVGT